MTTMAAIVISDSGEIQMEIHWIVVLVFFTVLLLASLHRKYFNGNTTYLELSEAEFGTDGIKGTYKTNTQDQQIGYMFWVELSTRKIGIPIDENHDVIVEVYNSWYEFFKISRELIKSIPVNKLQNNESTRQLVKITMYILNSDIREHLTQWQAKYRKWWELASIDPRYASLSPQEIQKLFPEYSALIADMKLVNTKLISYKSKLKNMIVGAKPL